MNFRPQRVGKLIRQELGFMLAKELEFPNALATITEVDVDKKLEHATVRLSVIPSSSAPDVLKIAKESAGRLQHLLLKKINIKPMPRIGFEIDHGPENAAAVEKALLEDR
jgi:ribosome-binding factor A